MSDLWFPILLAITLGLITLRLAFRKTKRPSFDEQWRELQPPRDLYAPFQQQPRDLDEPFRRAARNLKDHPPREAKSHPGLGAPYGRPEFGQRTIRPGGQDITFTPRQLERVNVQRRLAGRPPLNKAGFSNAIAHAWDQPRRQPETPNNWLTYFIVYQCLFADHQSPRVAVDSYITVKPEEPYNGHGGEFAGAGASGDWNTPAAAAAGLAAMAIGPYEPRGESNPTFPEPSAPAYSAPEPAPSYSAPDPAPSYSAPADSGGGYSSGSSSSSYDSGSSSSSSSSDGGGGGGGGGGD